MFVYLICLRVPLANEFAARWVEQGVFWSHPHGERLYGVGGSASAPTSDGRVSEPREFGFSESACRPKLRGKCESGVDLGNWLFSAAGCGKRGGPLSGCLWRKLSGADGI